MYVAILCHGERNLGVTKKRLPSTLKTISEIYLYFKNNTSIYRHLMSKF